MAFISAIGIIIKSLHVKTFRGQYEKNMTLTVENPIYITRNLNSCNVEVNPCATLKCRMALFQKCDQASSATTNITI
jgi:hypothetical protein